MRIHFALAAVLLLAPLVDPADRLVPRVEAQDAPARDVTVRGNAFQPPAMTVLVGSVVRWTNEDSTMHTVTHDADDPAFDEPIFPMEFSASGLNVVEVTFDTLGVFLYFCNIHASMRGQIDVVEEFHSPTVRIEAQDSGGNPRFEPDAAEADTTQTLVFRNSGTGPHNVRFEDTSINGGDLPVGGSHEVQITRAGVFRYRCTFHSSDFASGMVGTVNVSVAETAPPTINITSPKDGDTVNGTVQVTGIVTSGPNQSAATGVEVRVGTTGDWDEATFKSDTGDWSWAWNTTTVSNGPKTIFARAPTVTLRAPTPVSVDVTVNNAAANETNETTPPANGDSPGLGFGGLGMAFAIAVAAASMRRQRLSRER